MVGRNDYFRKLQIKQCSFDRRAVLYEEKLHPIRSTDEILHFVVATFHGIQTGYVLSNCYKTEHITERYKPSKMFDCLADSVIYMMGG